LAAASIFVAAIMPQAMGSGKLRAGRGSHAGLLDRAGFPQGGMIDGAANCSRSERSFRHPVPKLMSTVDEWGTIPPELQKWQKASKPS
jgi:hypothetical protein